MQADGKILAGGAFTTLAPNGGAAVTRNAIARLETDGTLDRTLNLGTVGNFVLATAIQPDGKILVGGTFTTVLGVARNNIARLNSDGTLDTAFNPNANGSVLSIVAQRGRQDFSGRRFHRHRRTDPQPHRPARCHDRPGRFVQPERKRFCQCNRGAGGRQDFSGRLFRRSNSIGGQTRNRIARLDPTTGLADSFNPNANERVNSIAVQADGNILVGGYFFGANTIGGQTRNRIARLDPTTGLADSFDPNANSVVESITVQADGKVLSGRRFHAASADRRATTLPGSIPTTGLADSFDPNANSLC